MTQIAGVNGSDVVVQPRGPQASLGLASLAGAVGPGDVAERGGHQDRPGTGQRTVCLSGRPPGQHTAPATVQRHTVGWPRTSW